MPKIPKWVTRFHRTRTDYTPAIDKEGLKAKSPNMGENTYVNNVKDLENVWLADNRYHIPVLRRYGASPDVTTYKVRIPYDKYWYEMKRNTMPKGRGGGKFKPVKPGQPSMFSEGDYKVDLIGEDISPQYLQKLPIYNKDPAVVAEDIWAKLTDAYETGVLNTDLAFEEATQYLPRRLRGEARAFRDKMASYQMGESNPPHQPSEELVRALIPSDKNLAIVDFVNKHRKNLSRTKSPAYAFTMTLDNAPEEIPVIYDAPLSWAIYDPAKAINPTADLPVHQGAISRGERSPLNKMTDDWHTSKAARSIMRKDITSRLNQRDASNFHTRKGYTRELDSLMAVPALYAARKSLLPGPEPMYEYIFKKHHINPAELTHWYYDDAAIVRPEPLPQSVLNNLDITIEPPRVQAIRRASDNADIIRNEFKRQISDDELRELDRLELLNNPATNMSAADWRWARLETPEILRIRQQALDKIADSWLYDMITNTGRYATKK